MTSAPMIADPPSFGAPQSSGSGFGDDIAVPDFIRQQMADKAAAEARASEQARAAEVRAVEQARLAAVAADPFSSAVSSSAQEIRLVIDDKLVSDAEVGRKNTGAIFTAVAVGVIALVAGYLFGDFKSSHDEEAKTRSAIGDIRHAVDATGTAVTTLKDKIDHAADRAGIQGEEAPAAAAPAPAAAQLDEELLTWFAQQSPDPPLAPDVYAGRVGRLRPELVSKLMKVQIELEQLWRDLQRHQALTSGANLQIIRSSLSEAQRVRTEYQHLAVVFGVGRGEGAPPVVATLVIPTFDEGGGGFTFPPIPGLVGPPHRTLYQTGDLAAEATIGTVGIPLVPGAGAVGNVVSNLGRPWSEYIGRLTRLHTQINTLQGDHRSLNDALSRAGVN